MTDKPFSPGDRVATNAAYAKRFPRMKQQSGGEIVSMHSRRPSSGQIQVLWDGRKTTDTVHATFLKREGSDG